ncbi:hypothetical protein [Pseudescherichia sp.]|uniref:hypothetical protein n=1 Tax=Pseudescherichia sp. TaxID=2055881 RepID=UPI0028978264|nr:hypothetical protein [Pseudescherichia sp.]
MSNKNDFSREIMIGIRVTQQQADYIQSLIDNGRAKNKSSAVSLIINQVMITQGNSNPNK